MTEAGRGRGTRARLEDPTSVFLTTWADVVR